MPNATGREQKVFGLYALLGTLTAVAALLLLFPSWTFSQVAGPRHWNAIAAFAITAMLFGGLSASMVETFVRRKPAIRVWFNTVQFMVAVGLGTLVYHALGGMTN